MRKIFNDTELENAFRRNGYAVVPFLPVTELGKLKQRLLELKPSDDYHGNQETLIGRQSFHVTFFDSNREYRKQVYDIVSAVFEPAADSLLSDYRCAQANVFLKQPKADLVYPHQNLTIVDEEKYTSLSFWMPLQDTDEHNGTVCLVPGSHKGFRKYRNTHVYWPYVPFFREPEGLKYLIPVNVKAGELLILHDSIVHYTPPNKASEARWVLHALWAPAEAPLLFCDPQENQVNIYEVENDFWQYQAPGARPEGRHPARVLPPEEPPLSETNLLNLLEALKARTAE